MRAEKHPLFRGNSRAYRGANWSKQAALARERDGGICQACGATCSEKLSVDHIVPFRLAFIYGVSEGLDPNDLRNLLSLCRNCHAKKTQAERRLLKGDLIGFIDAVKGFLPMDRVEIAMKLWGLGQQVQNKLMFEPVPEFLLDKGQTEGPKKVSKEVVEKMALMLIDGIKPKEIAAQFAVSYNYLYHSTKKIRDHMASHNCGGHPLPKKDS